jgi:hypothetical protein
MRVSCLAAIVTSLFLLPTPAAHAQVRMPGSDAVAVGASVGFLAPDNEPEEAARALEDATATVEAFVEYHYDAHVSLRGMYGWAQPAFEIGEDRALRRQQLTVSVSYGWPLGRFRPFASAGGGAYLLSRRDGDRQVGNTVTKPGGLLGWGVEYYLRTVALRTEMNVHILAEEPKLPELGGRTLSAFSWTFGAKVPF